PGADPRVDRGVKASVAVEILLDQRVLEPEQLHVVVDRPAHPDGVARIPTHEGGDVNDHVDVRPDGIPDRPGNRAVAPLVTAEGDREVVPPPALDVAVALGDEATELAADPVEVMRRKDGGGTGGGAGARAAAQEPVERDARSLPGDVPQRHVESADAEGDESAVAVPESRIAEPAPETHHVPRIATRDDWRQPALDDERHGERRLLATGDRLA